MSESFLSKNLKFSSEFDSSSLFLFFCWCIRMFQILFKFAEKLGMQNFKVIIFVHFSVSFISPTILQVPMMLSIVFFSFFITYKFPGSSLMSPILKAGNSVEAGAKQTSVITLKQCITVLRLFLFHRKQAVCRTTGVGFASLEVR